MKRILCLIDSLVAGGAQRQLVGLAVLLQKNGYLVKVVAYHDFPFYSSYLEENRVDYEIVHCGKNLISRLTKIGKSIKCYSPDVVISYLDTPNIISCIVKAFRFKWKLIVSERNTTQVITFRDRLKFFMYRFADCIIANSYSQNNFISANYPQYKNKCEVITNYVDTVLFSPAKHRSNESIRIIGVGRISHQKNIPILIEALKVVRGKGFDARVDWYGNPFDSFNECLTLINKYGLRDAFEFHEPFNPIVEKYQESDIFVLPSFYEGFPNVLCEAMSSGLISIASDVCDNRRIINDGVNGLLFQSNNVDDLINCLLRVFSFTNEQRESMTKLCRDYAIESFSEDTFIKKYIDLIER